MNLTDIKDISDIIELEYLQKIQDSLGRLIKITTAILNAEGVPITQPTNLYAFCEMMQASPDGVQMCMQTNSQLIEINKATRKAAVVICPNSGLKTAAVPIFLGDQFLGSWLIGQMRTDAIDLELIENTARQAGIPAADAKRSISLLPIITEEEFANILEFLDLFIKEITQLVKVNASLDLKNQQLITLSEQLNIAAATFREFIDLSDIGVYVLDYETGELLMHNDRYAAFVEQQDQDLIGQKCYHLLGQDTWCSFCPRDYLVNEQNEPNGPIIWENYLEDFNIWLRITSRAIRWIDGRLAHMVTFLDITEQKIQEERIAYIAYYDQRLLIPNGMRLFLDLNETSFASAQIICFDIQGLRKINDVYGRETGDNLLKEIKNWVLGLEEQNLQIYRVDGDEFAILMRNQSEAATMRLAKKIYNRFDEPWIINLGEVNQTIFASISMGIIPCSEPYNTYDSLLNDVERILSAARNRKYPLKFDAKINADFTRHLQMEVNLKECVLNNLRGFSVQYQPIVDAQTQCWLGLEALCRWHSPELGPIPPTIFIPEAEQLGLIDLVGEWILTQAVRQVKSWGLDRLAKFMLHVNLSPIQLNDRDLHLRVTQILQEADYPAKKLSLEITESAEVHFDEHILKSLAGLQQLGISLALDDFGTGYASFSMLNNLPISTIKTDRSFVTNIETDEYLQHMVRIMVEFAHSANMKVVAEGVETKEQMEILINTGVDYFQGYLFAKPLSGREIAKHQAQFRL